MQQKKIEDIFDVLCSLYVFYKLTILGYCYPRTHSLGFLSFLGGQVFFVICWAHRLLKKWRLTLSTCNLKL